MQVKIVNVTEENFDQIPLPIKRGFNCQQCFFWIGKWDGKLDLVKQKRRWLARKGAEYGPLAKIILWGKREKPIGYIQFGPITEFQTARMFYEDRLPVPRGGWCITCLSLQRLYQGRGLAKRMAHNILRDLKKRGVRVVDVYELPRFWEKLGFETVLGDKEKRVLIMRRNL